MNIYVGNIPYTVTEEDLRQAFGEFGTVTAASIIIDKMTGRSRGFGFVEMSSDEEGNRAIEEMNGKDWMGRMLTVNEAKPRERSGGFGGGGGGYAGGRRSSDGGGRGHEGGGRDSGPREYNRGGGSSGGGSPEYNRGGGGGYGGGGGRGGDRDRGRHGGGGGAGRDRDRDRGKGFDRWEDDDEGENY